MFGLYFKFYKFSKQLKQTIHLINTISKLDIVRLKVNFSSEDIKILPRHPCLIHTRENSHTHKYGVHKFRRNSPRDVRIWLALLVWRARRADALTARISGYFHSSISERHPSSAMAMSGMRTCSPLKINKSCVCIDLAERQSGKGTPLLDTVGFTRESWGLCFFSQFGILYNIIDLILKFS